MSSSSSRRVSQSIVQTKGGSLTALFLEVQLRVQPSPVLLISEAFCAQCTIATIATSHVAMCSGKTRVTPPNSSLPFTGFHVFFFQSKTNH